MRTVQLALVGGAGGYCRNLPYSFERQAFSGEIGYRITPRIKVILSDTLESTKRSYADASLVTQNTTTLKVRSRIDDDLFNAISFSHQDRAANSYVNGNTWALLSPATSRSRTARWKPPPMRSPISFLKSGAIAPQIL